MTVQNERDRLLKVFEGADENKLQLLDGVIWEAARLRVTIEELGKLPLIRVHPNNLSVQRQTQAGKDIVRHRANYLNYMKLLSKELGGVELENDDLEEFEND